MYCQQAAPLQKKCLIEVFSLCRVVSGPESPPSSGSCQYFNEPIKNSGVAATQAYILPAFGKVIC